MKYNKYIFFSSILFITGILIISIFSNALGPQRVLDPSAYNLQDAEKPPFWLEGGSIKYILGTDTQGRDLLSLLFFGTRISLLIAISAVIFSMIIGVFLGMISGYFGGWIDTIIMRIVDVQLALPAILIAMLVGGILRSVYEVTNIFITSVSLVLALVIATWSIYTRAVRAVVKREKEKEYISAARLMGLSNFKIIFFHILPNVRNIIGVIMIVDLANCIVLESTLSFLGLGLPPIIPSLGTTIRVGSNYFLSGTWWLVLFPSLLLIGIIYSINIIKDYLQE